MISRVAVRCSVDGTEDGACYQGHLDILIRGLRGGESFSRTYDKLRRDDGQVVDT